MCPITIIDNISDFQAKYGEYVDFLISEHGMHPNIQPDLFLSVLNHMDGVISPYVCTIFKDEQVRAILVGRIEMHDFICSIGYFKVLARKVRSLTLMHGGVVPNKMDPEDVNALIEELRSAKKRYGVDVIHFNMTRVDGSLFSALMNKNTGFKVDRLPLFQVHRGLEISNDPELFRKTLSKKHRSSVRYYLNRLKKEVSDQVYVKCIEKIEDIPVMVEEAETIASKTYQRGLGVGFRGDKLTLERFKVAGSKGMLKCFILYAGERPCAFQMGFKLNGTYHLMGKGYDPDLAKYRVGSYLNYKVIESLHKDEDIHFLDFGIGDADYKVRYADIQWDEATFYIYAKTMKGFFYYLINSVVRFVDVIVRSFLSKSKYFNKIKRGWRKSLMPNGPGTKR
jgi:hypothetical protein